MDILSIVNLDYNDMCDSIFNSIDLTEAQKISAIITSGVAVSNVHKVINNNLSKIDGLMILPEEFEESDIFDEQKIGTSTGENAVLKIVNDLSISSMDVGQLQMMYEVEFVYLVLPHQLQDYKLNQRFIIDKLLTDGIRWKCSDLKIEPVSDMLGGFKYLVKYRMGLHYGNNINTGFLDTHMLEDIIDDMITNRSSMAFKAPLVHTEPEIKFRITDPLYHLRCQTIKTIYGNGVNIRFLPQKSPFEIKTLTFSEEDQAQLISVSKQTSGFSLVSGVMGSGKGTTVNAIVLEIVKDGKYSVISVDSPIEYYGAFSQVEHYSEEHIIKICSAIKKYDINIVLLNEIATEEVAMAVYNLVTSGVHVITTIHSNRLYRIMYKLKETFGDKYLNLIPFMNLLSYQDKFSKTCNCLESIYIDTYGENSDERRLLKFLGLDIIKQPRGCIHCDNSGVNKKGIKVVTEQMFLTTKIKDDLLQEDVHGQSRLMKKLVDKGNNLESVCRKALADGEILIEEVINKLDTWR